MERFVSKSEFATMAKVSKPAIAKLTRPGGRLHAAVVDKKIDTTHADAVDYLARRAGVAVGALSNPDHTQETPREIPRAAPDALGILSIGRSRAELELELLQAKVTAQDLKNKTTIGELFHRDTFEKGVWNPLETMCRHWCSDTPRTLAAQVVPMVKGGADVLEIEQIIRKALSQEIKAMKSVCTRTLESLRTPESEGSTAT